MHPRRFNRKARKDKSQRAQSKINHKGTKIFPVIPCIRGYLTAKSAEKKRKEH